jgi:hypothetical protein
VASLGIHWTPIATAIGTLLGTALGQGPRVYTNVRWTNEPDQYKALFLNVSSQTINAWFVTREGGMNYRGGPPDGRQMQIEFGQVGRTHNVQIEGFHAFRKDGTSEANFQEQIDVISDALVQQLTIAGSMVYLAVPRLSAITLEKFGPALCHTCRITLDATIRTTATYVEG